MFLGNRAVLLCARGVLWGRHTHPGQWKSELQQFLLKYSEIPGSSCVCRTCDRSIRRGLHGKYKSEYFPRWIKQDITKEKQCCIGYLEAKLIDLKERMHTCMTSGKHNEVALLKAALSLREEMSDHAVTFPM